MNVVFEWIADFCDVMFSWMGNSLKQNASAYCDLQTADSPTVLVAHDGSLVSILKISGVTRLIGSEEFEHICRGLQQTLQTVMSQPGHLVQVLFSYNRDDVKQQITDILQQGHETAERLTLDLDDLFSERVNYLSQYCAREDIYLVLWTRLKSLSAEQLKHAFKDKQKMIVQKKIPPFWRTQNIIAAIPDLRESHDSFVRAVNSDCYSLGIVSELMEVHAALHAVRNSVDPDFTDINWRPLLPGDPLSMREFKKMSGEISDVLWPQLAKQVFPRDAENIDLRTVRIGDRIYSGVYIDLFPKDIQPFSRLLARVLQTQIPWRISFLIESNGLEGSALRKILSSVLSVTSAQNRLINASLNLLQYIQLNTDDAVVKLRVAACTWAPENDVRTLRVRSAMLAKAIEGWGSCDVSEFAGDACEGIVSSMLAISGSNVATPTIAPLSDVLSMLPLFRPASPWQHGAILFRSPDGKPWPYHPGSSEQTTWIDLVYARPGSGKSVLSNAINLAVCLSSGLRRLPRISIIDVGPSSSGLIMLLKDALPTDKKHLVAYHRLRMLPEYAINPFDTQLGCRIPTPQERSFLVNFLTLLATPVGAESTYDGVADMAGLIIDELYRNLAETGNPHPYARNVEESIDAILEEIGFVLDPKTSWWEITDALFAAGFAHEATMAQRHAMPVLADVTAICQLPAIKDLYGRITVATGESLIQAFSRMISSAVREYPIISQVTRFDLGDARVVSLDLDEVARSGGDAANRQTAVMYMLARYVLARHYYLTEENMHDMPDMYKQYHQVRIMEIREDPKRIVFDEFHRTAKAKAVREQVILDMREGRKWKVQVALLSQSLSDFDSAMVEFATSIFIMDAGPEQAVRKTAEVFGLTQTAQNALKNRVHGPREGGATFLAQFATKNGMNTQLLTLTLGPIELWSLNTTAEDVNLRNQLYKRMNPKEARRALAKKFPGGSAVKLLEERYAYYKEEHGLVDDRAKSSILEELVEEVMKVYQDSKTSA